MSTKIASRTQGLALTASRAVPARRTTKVGMFGIHRFITVGALYSNLDLYDDIFYNGHVLSYVDGAPGRS